MDASDREGRVRQPVAGRGVPAPGATPALLEQPAAAVSVQTFQSRRRERRDALQLEVSIQLLRVGPKTKKEHFRHPLHEPVAAEEKPTSVDRGRCERTVYDRIAEVDGMDRAVSVADVVGACVSTWETPRRWSRLTARGVCTTSRSLRKNPARRQSSDSGLSLDVVVPEYLPPSVLLEGRVAIERGVVPQALQDRVLRGKPLAVLRRAYGETLDLRHSVAYAVDATVAVDRADVDEFGPFTEVSGHEMSPFLLLANYPTQRGLFDRCRLTACLSLARCFGDLSPYG